MTNLVYEPVDEQPQLPLSEIELTNLLIALNELRSYLELPTSAVGQDDSARPRR